MQRLQRVVFREDYEERTCGIVSCTPSQLVRHESQLLAAISAAVTEWVATTADGQDAWNSTERDFNLGDLAQYQDDEALVPLLKKHGIENLEILTYVDEKHSWSYDLHLVDEHRLPDEIVAG